VIKKRIRRVVISVIYGFWVVVVFISYKNALFAQVNSHDNVANRPIEEAIIGDHWITRPSNGTITVIGIAGRKRRQEEALAEALADAARKISLYHGVYGESVSVLNNGSNLLEYFADTAYRLAIRNESAVYIESLVFDKETDVLERNGSVYVRARYTGVSGVPLYKSELKDGMPHWVAEYQAEIPGFLVGIGTSKNKGSPQKTHQASYENAIVSLLPQLATQMTSSVVDIEGGGKMTQNFAFSYGLLSRVMILETWFDKRNGAIWTLLAAKAD